MPAPRMAMRKLREILRLSQEKRLSGRAIAASCGVSASTVQEYLRRIKVADLRWPLPAEMDDSALDQLLFPHKPKAKHEAPGPDWALVHLELKKKHVTKSLVWQEYREQHPSGYGYSYFCEQYARWAGDLHVTMRQQHRAGEKLFVDFSGDGLAILDAATGQCRVAKLFVAVLGASNYTYVEAVYSEDLPTWIGCHIRALQYFGAVPDVVVPDNLKSGVKRPDFYDPVINRTYADWAEHYGVAVIPTRVRRPRDKAKVEQGVLLAERWILAALRHATFDGLQEFNAAIRPLLEKLNNKPMRKVKQSRRDLFDVLDKPAMKALPAQPFAVCTWKKATVSMDYHVEFDDHYYSVHHTHAQEHRRRVEIRATDTVVEIYWQSRRIASHLRSERKHQHTTSPEHMPDSHRRNLDWPPSRIIAWAQSIGPMTLKMVEELMQRRPHPEQGYRACMGLLRLRDSYPDTRIERACAYAVKYQMYSCQSIRAVLKNKRDELPLDDDRSPPTGALPTHGNIRGPTYYH